jgi:hypothetical protein
VREVDGNAHGFILDHTLQAHQFVSFDDKLGGELSFVSITIFGSLKLFFALDLLI